MDTVFGEVVFDLAALGEGEGSAGLFQIMTAMQGTWLARTTKGGNQRMANEINLYLWGIPQTSTRRLIQSLRKQTK